MSEDSAPGSSDLKRRGIVAAGWTVLKTWYVRLSSLLAIVVLARILSPSQFGVVAIASVFIAVATSLADLGLTPSLIRSSDRSKAQLDTAFWLGLTASALLFVLLQVIARPTADFFAHPILEPVIRVLAFVLPLTSLASVPTSILTRDLQMKPLAVRQMIGTTVGTIGAVVLALAGFGVWSLVFQTVCPAFIGVIILWRSVQWRPSFRVARAHVHELASMGAPIVGSQLVHQLRDRGAELLIGAVLGAQILGYWVVAGRIVRVFIDLFTTVVNTVSLPAFASTVSDPARFARGIRYAIRVSTLISMPLFVGLAIVSPTLIPLVFGGEWAQTGAVAQIVIITAAFNAIQWIDSNIWWAMGRPSIEFTLTIIISAIHFLVVFLVTPFGLIALAWAILIRTLSLMVLRVFALRIIGGVPLSIYKDLPGILAASAVAAGVALLVGRGLAGASPWAYVVIEGLVMAVAYVAALVLFQRSTLLETVRDVRRLRGGRQTPAL